MGATARPAALARRDVDAYRPPWTDFGDFLQQRQDAGRPYLVTVDEEGRPGRQWTVAQWQDLVTRVADRLVAEHGLGPGDHLATLAGNTPEGLAFAFGAWLVGACVVPLDPTESDERHAHALRECGARLVGVDADPMLSRRTEQHPGVVAVRIADLLDAPHQETRAPGAGVSRPGTLDVPALRVRTSGTTGGPKSVVLTMRSILVNCAAMQEALGWGPDTRVLTVLPIQHVNGLLINSFMPWYAGGSTVLWERFRSRRFWSVVDQTRATTSSLVPTVLEFLLAEGGEPGHRLEEVVSGSGPLRPATAEAFEQRFAVPVRQLYGLSETTAVLTVTPRVGLGGLPDELRASVGSEIPHASVDVHDPAGEPCRPGRTGEIVARGAMLLQEYAGDPDANAQAFAGGWFHTGDRGHWELGPDGRRWLFVDGRLRESIQRGGLTVVPHVIDEVVESHPHVQHAAAFAFPNRWYGEEVAVFVVPRGHVEEHEILAWCEARLDRAHCPKVVVFGTELPMTRTGKVRRSELAADLAEELAPRWADSFRTTPPEASRPHEPPEASGSPAHPGTEPRTKETE
ncbi:class I adenylate-forming enzyme family protein [Nocardioides sp. LHG3406-4]|uniref:class I adenylate-forming enzyme family protein n=1 Tax=Nocardioides sp. LHG3406-4 TaxID=2804575 RepID=UPI003CF5F559